MLRRSATLALISAFVLAWASLQGCAYVGKQQVHVETGNQPVGYISRPMLLTTASDDSVRSVAQDICDNVRAGSTAKISFVGKVPAPDPVSLGDWGRYRYECEAPAPAAATAPHTSVTVPPPAAAAPPYTSVPVRPPPVFPSQGAGAKPVAAVAAPASDQVRAAPDQRACILQKGNLHLCLANCMINSTSPVDAVEPECRQRCAGIVAATCD